MSNFTIKMTGGVDDWAVVKADIDKREQPSFTVSIATMTDSSVTRNNVLYAGTGVVYGANLKSFEYPVKHWAKTKFLYITINSP